MDGSTQAFEELYRRHTPAAAPGRRRGRHRARSLGAKPRDATVVESAVPALPAVQVPLPPNPLPVEATVRVDVPGVLSLKTG